MKRLRFHYRMKIDFDIPVKEHRFTLKCLPKDNSRQKINTLTYEVFPNRFISRSYDGFGNDCIYGLCAEQHNAFLIDLEGEAECGLAEYESEGAETDAAIFRYQTEHTQPGRGIREYYKELQIRSLDRKICNDRIEIALFYLHQLHADYEYRSGSTQITTTAEEAFTQGCGVCQDYAHILLSLLRIGHIPCRYVTGMMLGEGLSHAWVEVFDGTKWIALDPTNDIVVGDDHIRIAAGRDYRDCLINQGMFTGCGGKAEQDQSIYVQVEEIR